MIRQHQLPDLFGRITLVLDEHPTLRNTARELEVRCGAIVDGSSPPSSELLVSVADFAEKVLAHFEVEERPEYFGTLAEEAPALRAPIDALKLDHREMQSLLGEIQSAIRAGAATDRFVSLVEDFLGRLAEHERRETALLEAFFLSESPS